MKPLVFSVEKVEHKGTKMKLEGDIEDVACMIHNLMCKDDTAATVILEAVGVYFVDRNEAVSDGIGKYLTQELGAGEEVDEDDCEGCGHEDEDDESEENDETEIDEERMSALSDLFDIRVKKLALNTLPKKDREFLASKLHAIVEELTK